MKKFIYLISPNKIDKNFYYSLTKVLKSQKIKFFQLRLKKIKKYKIVKIAQKVKKITKKFNVKLIINDNPEIAKETNADGCHLGQLDVNILKAKEILKKKIIGVPCHGSIKLAYKAIAAKPSHITVGSFYKSKLKPKAKKAKIVDLKKIRDKTKLPIVAIGGVNQKNYKKLLNSGANYIAISSFIWNNPILNPSDAIKRIK